METLDWSENTEMMPEKGPMINGRIVTTMSNSTSVNPFSSRWNLLSKERFLTPDVSDECSEIALAEIGENRFVHPTFTWL